MSDNLTKCKGEACDKICPLRENCLRYKYINVNITSYFMDIPYDEIDGKCEFYLETKE